MPEPPPIPAPPSPAPKSLNSFQRRVLGVLIEKAKTTPAAYPMTVNSLVAGCNQKNNRDPLTTLDDIDVERALDQLRTLGVVSELDWLGRVPKYKHLAYEWLGVSKPEIAVMTELLLRGAQPLGELRARAARMEPIADLAELKPIVDRLVERGLVIELTAPGRGQIVSHNLYLPSELVELKARYSTHTRTPPAFESEEPAPTPSPASLAHPVDLQSVLLRVASEPTAPEPTAELVTRLSAEVAELRAEVAGLRERVRELEARLG